MSDLTKRSFFTLILFILGCLAVGAAGGAVTSSSVQSWYAGVQKPPLNPPSWMFAPVWSVLYILMAVAGWRFWTFRFAQSPRLKSLFAFQFVCNALWSFIFFGLRNPLGGLADIALLWVSLLILVRLSWREDRISGFLLTPYLLWVSFAVYLNASVWWLNR